jgi:hypothetical protein
VTSTATGPTRSRALRAAVFALVAVVVAGLGHAGGHGAVPGGASLAGAVVVALVIGAAVSGTRWSRLRLLGALAAVQVVVHGAAWISGGSGAPVDPRLAAAAGDALPEHLAHAAHTAHAPFTVRMLLAHLVAVVLAAVLLAATEHAAAFVVATARRLAPPAKVVLPALPPVPLRDVVVAWPMPAPHLVVVRGHAPPVLLGT